MPRRDHDTSRTRSLVLSALVAATTGCARSPAALPAPGDARSADSGADASEAPDAIAGDVTAAHAPIAPTSREAGTAPPVTDEYLAWTRDAHGATTTRWILRDPGGAARVVATRPGVVVAAGGRLWTWRERRERVPLVACARTDAEYDDETGRISGYAMATSGAFVASATGAGEDARVAPVAPLDEGATHNTAYEHRVALLATVGPYAFVRVEFWMNPCGAVHGSGETGVVAWDLAADRSLAIADLVTPAEQSALVARARGAARRDLVAQAVAARAAPGGAGNGGDADDARGDEPTLDALLPRYARDATAGLALRLTYVYTAFACYLCGSHPWGSYSRAAFVASPVVPARLAPFASPPDAVRAATARWLARGGSLGGYSVVTARSMPEREALFASFAAAR